MPRTGTVRLLAIFLLPVAACATLHDPAHLTESERAVVIQRAREMVLAGTVLQGSSEADFIKANKPSLGYYFLARPDADYDIRWSVKKDEAIVIHGQGNILELEGAVIERKQLGI